MRFLQKWLEVSSRRHSGPPCCELCQYQYLRHKKFVVRRLLQCIGNVTNTRAFFLHSDLELAISRLFPTRQSPSRLLRLLRAHHDRLRRRDNHLLQRGLEHTTLKALLLHSKWRICLFKDRRPYVRLHRHHRLPSPLGTPGLTSGIPQTKTTGREQQTPPNRPGGASVDLRVDHHSLFHPGAELRSNSPVYTRLMTSESNMQKISLLSL